MKKHFNKLLFALLLLFPGGSLSAQTSLLGNIKCIESGNCNLNDILQVAVNASQILLELSGAVALLFFVYGGITFLISGGSSEKVAKGKQIIVNSVIGLVIIFTSFVIINFAMDALGFVREGGVFSPWNQSNG